jgi:hypothetical protein
MGLNLKELSKKKWLFIIIAIFLILLILFRRNLKNFFFFENKYPYNKSNTTIDAQTAKQIAEYQFNAMGGIGTDNSSLFNSLKGLTTDDLILVYNSFGKREYSVVGYPASKWLNKWSTKEDLLSWYNKELNYLQYNRMKKLWENTNLNFP